MNVLSLKTLLLVLAILLFLIAVIDDSGRDWIADRPRGRWLPHSSSRRPAGAATSADSRCVRTIEGRESGPQSRLPAL